ncbi:MAG: hypothetical protein ACP5HZ_11010 [Ferrimicrobium sp.]
MDTWELTDCKALQARVLGLEAELRKFHLCESSNGCYDSEGMVHSVRQAPGSALRSARARHVYHKEGS